MSLDKAVEHGKERRKPYRGAEAFDPSCRPHGGDPWSRGNRTHADRRARKAAERQLREWRDDRDD